MKNMQITKILSEPEGPNLEFKERIPQSNMMARLMSAFANSDGGMVLLGVGHKGALIGVRNLDQARNKISHALDMIKPRPEVETSVQMVDDKAVLVLNIRKSDKAPHTVNNLLFQRSGSEVVPVDSRSLYSQITKDSNTLAKIHSDVARLTEVIEEQNKQLIYAQNWRAKLPDMLLGALIGAAISILFQFFL